MLPRKPWMKHLLQAAISLFCLFWVYRQLRDVELGEMTAVMSGLHLPFLAASCGLVTTHYFIRLGRLRWWVKRLGGHRQPKGYWIDMYLKSTAFAAFTPAKLGEFSRVFILRDTGLETRKRTLLVVQEKIQDVIGLPLTVILAAGAVSPILKLSPLIIILAGLFMLLGNLGVSVFAGRFLGVNALAGGWAITSVAFGFFLFANAFLFWAAGADLTVADIAAIAVISGLLAALPISFGGIGVREGSLLALLSIWGVSRETQLAVIALEFFINMIWPALLYGLWLPLRHTIIRGEHHGP